MQYIEMPHFNEKFNFIRLPKDPNKLKFPGIGFKQK